MSDEKKESIFEISLNTRDFVHILNFAGSVVEKRNVMLELSNIKLTATPRMLTVGATDMDLYLNQQLGAEVVQTGETMVSAQTLSEIVRKMPDQTIRICQNKDSDKLIIIGNRRKFELLTMSAEQFPALEEIEANSSFIIAVDRFIKIIEYTIFSMSNEETRYNLNGVYMHVKDKELFAVSTDGHRLSISTASPEQVAGDCGVILPRKTVSELLKILKDIRNSKCDVEVLISDTKVKFKAGNLVLISKLIDGTFPEYNNFIPQDNEHKLTISAKLLADAIDRVATVTIDKFRAVKFLINDAHIEITASGEAKGAASEIIEYSDEDDIKYNGANISIGFNPKYLSDVLSALGEGRTEILFKDSSSPVLIKKVGSEMDNFVIMPVKV